MPAGGETPGAFARRAVENGVDPAFQRFTAAIARNAYAGRAITAAELEQGKKAYTAAKASLTFRQHLRWLKMRLVKGPGDTEQIP